MKRQNIINLIVVLFLGFVTTAVATGFEPGSEEDPIVTKGYVDTQIIELKKLIQNGTGTSTGTQTDKANYVFNPLKVNKGLSVIGKQGTEVIIRSGTASAITITKDGIENGLQDITDGIDIKKDRNVPLNHLIIIPRDDGRGIKFDTDSYIMIRGEYGIK